MNKNSQRWRVIVVGGHTRSIGKTQLVCDLIAAYPQAHWVAGKITQYGHGVCAQNGENCDCVPDDHVCAISWETRSDTGTDSGRFLEAGAERSFWLRTKQGYLAEGLPLLRKAMRECGDVPAGETRNLIIESNTLLQFVRPTLYLMVLHPGKDDFKDSAKIQMDRASAFVLRKPLSSDAARSPWTQVSTSLLGAKQQFVQKEGEGLPADLRSRVELILHSGEGIEL